MRHIDSVALLVRTVPTMPAAPGRQVELHRHRAGRRPRTTVAPSCGPGRPGVRPAYCSSRPRVPDRHAHPGRREGNKKTRSRRSAGRQSGLGRRDGGVRTTRAFIARRPLHEIGRPDPRRPERSRGHRDGHRGQAPDRCAQSASAVIAASHGLFQADRTVVQAATTAASPAPRCGGHRCTTPRSPRRSSWTNSARSLSMALTTLARCRR